MAEAVNDSVSQYFGNIVTDALTQHVGETLSPKLILQISELVARHTLKKTDNGYSYSKSQFVEPIGIVGFELVCLTETDTIYRVGVSSDPSGLGWEGVSLRKHERAAKLFGPRSVGW